MDKKKLHDLVEQYWIVRGKSFRPYYLHEAVDNEGGHEEYQDFIKWVQEQQIKE